MQSQDLNPLLISEFLASNDTSYVDEDGEPSDWIELWNRGESVLHMQGWFLTDDPGNLLQWGFPDMTLDAGERVIVFASGKDRGLAGGELHANFRLNQAGEYLALTRNDAGTTVIEVEFNPFPNQRENYSYGLVNDTPGEFGYFKQPTPGASNTSPSILGFVADTTFSVDRGFYFEPIDLEVTTATPGATLKYTLDGRPPGINEGASRPASDDSTPPVLRLTIRETTCLRVLAVKEGYEPSNIDTHTYIFPEQALNQEGQGSPYDQSVHWGHAGPDWEMDPEILQSPNNDIRPQAVDFLKIPSVSLVLNFQEMFGQGGIYIAGESVEKETSIELLNPDALVDNPNARRGFQVDGTVQIVGGSSPNRWKSDNLSMRLKFQPDLEYPVFGVQAVDRFDTLVLDARLNNVWHYGGGSEPEGQRGRAQYVRDQFAANLHNAMGGLSPHGKHMHVFINGIYWGMHTVHERPDDNFAAGYLGGDNEDYDSIKHSPNDVLQGTSDNYLQLHSLAGRDLSDPANYEAVAGLLDIDDFIRYMLMNYYIGNTDWAHHNWYASYNRNNPEGRWRFHSWDAEKGLHRLQDNVTGRDDGGGPTRLHHNLVANDEYRLRFADLAYHHLRHGVLTPENTARMYREITDPIDLVMRLESARWGDNQREPPYTRLDWLKIRSDLLGAIRGSTGPLVDYFNQRSGIVLAQFQNRGWLPPMEPPAFNQHGGTVSRDFQIQLASQDSGVIYFTTDGTDPRIPGRGGNVESTLLVPEQHEKKAFMPEDGSLENEWFEMDFNDSGWPSGSLGAGYENNSGYENLIDSSLDFSNQVSAGANETIYMRIEFQLDPGEPFDGMELRIRYDDGFVAYLNGIEIARANAPGTAGDPAPWNASASGSHSDSAADDFQTFDVFSDLDLLVEGRNVLAIHGLNVNENSSDFLLWPVLTATRSEGGEPSQIHPSALPYESPFTPQQSITVKARVKNGEQWSPLAQAEFLLEAVPASTTNLVVSRLHYHPVAPNQEELNAGFVSGRDFEFLELMNVGASAVNLGGLRFADGIDFLFDLHSDLFRLEPGASFFLVANREAFRMRHGDSGVIAGEFQNATNLGNGGERIALINSASDVVFDFQYNDSAPWPLKADGEGYSLKLIDPESVPDMNDPSQWQAHAEAGALRNGNGADPYQQWLQQHFTESELQEPLVSGHDADPDHDGISNMMEFFHVGNPRDPSDGNGSVSIQKAATPGQVEIAFRKRSEIGMVAWVLLASSDLEEWTDAMAEVEWSREVNQDGTESVRIQISADQTERFYRLKVSL